MTITTPTDKLTVNGNGVTTVFSFSPITIFVTGDLTVTHVTAAGVETLVVEGVGATNYSVQITSPNFLPSTGTITYPASGGSPLPTGEKLIIKRELDLLQSTNLENQGGYLPETQEAAFDKATMIDIQQQEMLNRSVRTKISTTGINTELPAPSAGQAIGWNGSGTGFQNITPTITADISSALIVVSGSAPALVDGRIWIDTSVVGKRIVKMCDGVNYAETLRYDTTSDDITINEPVTHTVPLIVDQPTGDTILTLRTADAGAFGPTIWMEHNSPSVANNDIVASILMKGKDSLGNITTYAEDQAFIEDITDGSEDGVRVFRTRRAGTMLDRWYIGNSLYAVGTGANTGAGTVNALGYYINGVPIPGINAFEITGTTHSPTVAELGQTFLYTNAAGCTVTLPTIGSGVGGGWYINAMNGSTGIITFNRSSTNVIYSRGTSLTTLRLPEQGNGGTLMAMVDTAPDRWMWFGNRSFRSTEQTITSAGLLTLAHNLGIKPRNLGVILKNVNASAGYVTGDETPALINGHDVNRGQSIVPDSTNLNIRYGSAASVYAIAHKTTGVFTAVTNADWTASFTAEVQN